MVKQWRSNLIPKEQPRVLTSEGGGPFPIMASIVVQMEV